MPEYSHALARALRRPLGRFWKTWGAWCLIVIILLNGAYRLATLLNARAPRGVHGISPTLSKTWWLLGAHATLLTPVLCLLCWLALSAAVNSSAAQLVGDLGCVPWAMDRRARFTLIVQNGLRFTGILALALVPLAIITVASRPKPPVGWNAAFHMGGAFDALVSITILGIWFAALTTEAWPRRRAILIAAVVLILPAAIGIGASWLDALSGWPMTSPYSAAAAMQMPCAPLLLHLNRLVAEHGYVAIAFPFGYPFRLPLVGAFLPPLVNVLWALANYWFVYWAILRQRLLRRAKRTPA